MDRVPNTGPRERERRALIHRYKNLLRDLERVPQHRREDECADVREDLCQRMLGELGAPGYESPPTPSVDVVDIDGQVSELLR